MNSLLKRAQALRLSPFMEGRFWIVNIENVSLEEVEYATSFLQKDDVKRALQFVLKKDQDRCILIQSLLKCLLGTLLNTSAKEISFQRNSFGKPYLLGTPVHFNLSHTDKKALLGIHPTRSIGVDLEEINRNFEEDLFLLPSEKKWLSLFKTRSEGILSLWCAKEALLKAEGTGFSSNVFPCFESLEKGTKEVDILKMDQKRVYVFHEALEGYKIAVSIL